MRISHCGSVWCISSLPIPARHIVKLIASYKSPTTFFVLLEPALGGDLLRRLESLPGNVYPEAEAARHARALLLAVQHLHCRRVVHRDIKPSNVLLSGDGHVRLADFGLSERLAHKNGTAVQLSNWICGTHDFLAPEM